MAVISTEKVRLSHVVKQMLWPELGYCIATVTVNDAAATLEIGTVLGKVTVGGKYKVAVQTAIDGSEVADAIVVEAVTVPATTDTSVTVLLRGPASVSKAGLVLDATYDLDAEKAAVYAALEAKGIQVRDAV